MNETVLLNFLRAYLRLFGAVLFTYIIFDNKIYGDVTWIDEDESEKENERQQFVMYFEGLTDDILVKAKLLCEYLFERKMLDGDRIVVSELELVSLLTESKWLLNDARQVVNFILSFDVKMIDDGEETDSFFIHG